MIEKGRYTMPKKKRAYFVGYLEQFLSENRALYLEVADNDCDAFATLDAYLGCRVFKEINRRENPKYLNMSYFQLLEVLSYDDHFDWEHTTKKENVDREILWWTGYVITYFHWYFCIDFEDWLKYFSVKDVYNMYYPMHEASIQVSAEKLYEIYQRKKKDKEFRK